MTDYNIFTIIEWDFLFSNSKFLCIVCIYDIIYSIPKDAHVEYILSIEILPTKKFKSQILL